MTTDSDLPNPTRNDISIELVKLQNYHKIVVMIIDNNEFNVCVYEDV